MSATGFCSRCGSPLNPGARFCIRCGNDVSGQQESSATVKVASPQPTVDPWLELQHKLVRATIGEYEIHGEIGRGGMASVYLAHDIALDRKVAIKVMSPDLFRDAAMADRFKREARTAASLSHPHIIHIYAVKQSADILFFVMELIRGRPLDVLLRESGPMPLPMAQYLLAQIGGALGYAHRRGIVHRDVKPANVMVDEEGKAIVTDFGIAKVAEAKGLTMTGATIGTPAYMSPEQCNAREVTGASDQYSLGIMAYEMFAGKTPFQADTLMGIMYQHFNEQPAPLTNYRPDLPPPVLAAVWRMLAKKADDRYPSIENSVQALGNVVLAHDDPNLLQLIKWVEADPQRNRFASPTPPRSAVPVGRPSAATTPVPLSSAPPVAVGAAVDTLMLEPAEAELRPGESATLKAYPRDKGGSTLAGKRVEWASSSPAVATVDSQGRVSAAAEGRTTISATCEGHSASAQVLVQPLSVAKILISPAGGRVIAGESLRLVASVQGSAGASLVGRRVTWSSAAPSIASVDTEGVVTGLEPGQATVTAASDGITAAAQVTVVPQAVATLRLDDPLGGRPFTIGQSVRLRAVPLGGTGQPLGDREVRWASSVPAVIEISEEGVATAIAPGRAKVTASCEGIRSALDVVVPVPAIEAAEITAKVRGITIESPAAPNRPRQPRPVPQAKPSRMPMLVGAAVVVLAALGFVVMRLTRGAAPGTGPAPATPSTQVATPAAVPSRPADTRVATVAVIPADAALAVGDSLVARIIALNAADSQLSVPGTVRWSSSNPAVATVSSRGVVKVLKDGRATITAGYSERSATLALVGTALRAVVATVVPQPLGAPIWIGDTLTLAAEAKDPAGAVLGGRVIVWSSSDPRVARVDAAGHLRAVAPGRATLTASSDGKRGNIPVTVTAIPVGAVTIDQTTMTLTTGQTQAVRAKVTDPRGRPLERAVIWSSSATSVASVGSNGLIKAEGVGTARVSAEIDGKRAEVAVTVPSGLKEMPVATATRPGAPATPPASTEGGKPTASVPAPIPAPTTTTTATTPNAPAAAGASAFAPGELQLGGGQSCALMAGELWCWGAGRSAAAARVGGMRFAEVSVGAAHSCGISDGKAYCWGANGKGQLGNNSTAASGTPTEVGGGIAWRSIAAGGTHSCGVTAAGKVLCWGENKSGQLGDGTTSDRRIPTAITGTGSTTFTQVAAGKGHTCALTAGGKAWCWGDGFAGQLGTGLTQVSSEPTEVAGRATFVRLDLGDSHSCGVSSTGQGWCWGEGRFGQLGEGATNDRSAPVQVRVSEPLADITAGGTHSCAVARGGQVFCWGGNASGQLGDGSRVNRTRPVLVPVSGSFTSVGAGSAHSCATGVGGAFCWGDGRQGQLGDGGAAARPEPGPVTRG